MVSKSLDFVIVLRTIARQQLSNGLDQILNIEGFEQRRYHHRSALAAVWEAINAERARQLADLSGPPAPPPPAQPH
jgi:hypothetical protein